jgi:hypothetical protein
MSGLDGFTVTLRVDANGRAHRDICRKGRLPSTNEAFGLLELAAASGPEALRGCNCHPADMIRDTARSYLRTLSTPVRLLTDVNAALRSQRLPLALTRMLRRQAPRLLGQYDGRLNEADSDWLSAYEDATDTALTRACGRLPGPDEADRLAHLAAFAAQISATVEEFAAARRMPRAGLDRKSADAATLHALELLLAGRRIEHEQLMRVAGHRMDGSPHRKLFDLLTAELNELRPPPPSTGDRRHLVAFVFAPSMDATCGGVGGLALATLLRGADRIDMAGTLGAAGPRGGRQSGLAVARGPLAAASSALADRAPHRCVLDLGPVDNSDTDEVGHTLLKLWRVDCDGAQLSDPRAALAAARGIHG